MQKRARNLMQTLCPAVASAWLCLSLLAAPALAQRSAAPAPGAAPGQPGTGQSGGNPSQEQGSAKKTGPTPQMASPASGAGYTLAPAKPGDTHTFKLMPDGAGGFKLVPAAPGDANTYTLIPPAPPSASASVPPGAAAPTEPQTFYVGFQATGNAQHVFPFRSPYAGAQSFLSRNETEATDTYTIYTGYRVNPRLEAYLDPEVSKGHGLSQGFGLGTFTNGDVVRTPTLDQNVYLARYYLRGIIPLGKDVEKVAQGETQLAGARPTRRIVVTGGKMAVSDLFDTNRYANTTRTQFMNWGLINCAAYDYAADTRGYTQGIAAEYITPDGALRYGVYQMPKSANFIQLSSDYKNNNGQQIEAELHPHFMKTKAGAGIVRVTGFHNKAHMGNYRKSVELAKAANAATGAHLGDANYAPPDITATETVGNGKYGYILGFEQPLADGGNTGIFGRFGTNDGVNEDFAYTECDRTGSLGIQVSGAKFRRPDDVFALALEQNDLSSAHRDYLAAGGSGFLLGDGKLRYGSERLLEAYYNYQLSKHGAATTIFVTPDYQYIRNPGFNADRGPVAAVVSLRVHLEF